MEILIIAQNVILNIIKKEGYAKNVILNVNNAVMLQHVQHVMIHELDLSVIANHNFMKIILDNVKNVNFLACFAAKTNVIVVYKAIQKDPNLITVPVPRVITMIMFKMIANVAIKNVKNAPIRIM